MKKELKELFECGNKNPFSVPENYFEDFAAKINAKIAPPKVSLFEKTKPVLYFAAMFLGVFFVLKFMTEKTVVDDKKQSQVVQVEQNNKYKDLVLSEIDEDVIMEYLSEND